MIPHDGDERRVFVNCSIYEIWNDVFATVRFQSKPSKFWIVDKSIGPISYCWSGGAISELSLENLA